MARILDSRERRAARHWRKSAACLLIAAALVLSAGCLSGDRQQAKDLVDAGSKTSGQLADFYNTLAQESRDWPVLYSLDQDRTGTAVTERTRQDFKETEEALLARASLAQRLKATYDALGKLIDYDAAGQTQQAVDNLKSAIETATQKKLKLPIGGLSAGESTKVLDAAIKALAGWLQMREFRKGVPKVQIVLVSVASLFLSEKDIYTNISIEYYKQNALTAKYLIDHGFATQTDVLQKPANLFSLQIVPDPYGLQGLSDEERQNLTGERKIFRDWLFELCRVKLEEFQQSSQKKADAIAASLAGLQQMQADFLKHKRAA